MRERQRKSGRERERKKERERGPRKQKDGKSINKKWQVSCLIITNVSQHREQPFTARGFHAHTFADGPQ